MPIRSISTLSYENIKTDDPYYRDENSVEKVYVSSELKKPFRINFKEKHLYNIFKYTLLGFNGFLILLIIGGVFIYFTEYRDKTIEMNEVEQENFLAESFGTKSGPRYAWVTTTFAFALLLAIPCTGFVGTLKEHDCLLVVYGVIFFVEAIVCLIFKTFWFLFPAFISLCAIGLVFLRHNSEKSVSRSLFTPFRQKNDPIAV